MKEIRICWLYNEILDLYGDGGNLSALTYQLDHNHIPYSIEHKGLYDTLDFESYDLYYMGPSKDRNVLEAGKRLNGYQKEIQSAVASGKFFLIIGNAQLLFGKSFTYQNETYPGLGLFDYSGEITGKVFINDYVMDCSLCNEPVYGFINRTSRLYDDGQEALFKVRYSQNDIGTTEGKWRQNYFSSWALGPLLAKNPALLEAFLKRLTGRDDLSFDDALMRTAYQKTLQEFDLK